MKNREWDWTDQGTPVLWLLLWSECLHPPKIHTEVLMSKVDGFNWHSLWKMIRSWGWRLHEWDVCFSKRDPIELPCPVEGSMWQIQREICDLEEDPQPTVMASGSWTPRLQSCENWPVRSLIGVAINERGLTHQEWKSWHVENRSSLFKAWGEPLKIKVIS